MQPITDILRQIRKGKVVDQASRLMAELVRAVDETGKKGTLTIELEVKPDKDGGSMKVIAAKIKVKKPLEDLPDAIFFSDEEGDLHREEPRQGKLFAATDDDDVPSGARN